MYLGGGGIHGHPNGPAAGVRAIRHAWTAASKGQSPKQAIADCPDLSASFQRWGGEQ